MPTCIFHIVKGFFITLPTPTCLLHSTNNFLRSIPLNLLPYCFKYCSTKGHHTVFSWWNKVADHSKGSLIDILILSFLILPILDLK